MVFADFLGIYGNCVIVKGEPLAAGGPSQQGAGQQDGDQGVGRAPAGEGVGDVGQQQEEGGHKSPPDLRHGADNRAQSECRHQH